MFSAIALFSGPYGTLARWGVVTLLCFSLFIAGYVKGHHSAEIDFERYRSGVEALTKQAEANTAAKILINQANKKVADANYTITLSNLRTDLDRMRKRNASGGGLSAPTPITVSANGTCFDSAKLDAALRKLDEGILELVESGSKAVIGLDTAKSWALKMTSELR